MKFAWLVVVGESDFEGIPCPSEHYFENKDDANNFYSYMEKQSPSDLIQYVRAPNYIEVKLPKVFKKGEWHP